MASVLRVIRGPLEGSVYVLGDRTRIGRAVDAHIQLAEAEVSRHHARIVRRNDGSFHLADLSSKAGTLVDGEAVKQHALCVAERITIGATEFVFEERGGAPLNSSPRFGEKVRGFEVVRATECFMPIPHLPRLDPPQRAAGAEVAGPQPVGDGPRPEALQELAAPQADAVPYAPGYAQHGSGETALPTAETAVRRPRRRRSTDKNLRAAGDVPHVNLVVRESWAASAQPADSESNPQGSTAGAEADEPMVAPNLEAPAWAPPSPVEPTSLPTARAGVVPESPPTAASEEASAIGPGPTPEQANAPRVRVEDAPRPKESAARRSPPQTKDAPSGPHVGVGADPEARERGLKILREVLEYRDLRLRDLRGEDLSAAKRARYEGLQLRLMNTVDQEDLPGSRRYQRFACSLPACVLQRDGELSRTLEVELEDLSAGGARITASDPAIRVGDELWLAFDLAVLFSYGQKVVFRCRVVWTRPLHAKLGLMFGGTARFAATLDDATREP